MRIVLLRIEKLRVLDRVEIAPGLGLNWIVGANGAGKTSVLEGIYLAGRGRTFRHPDAGPMIRQGEEEALVFVRMRDPVAGRETSLGVLRQRKTLECRLNGITIKKRSELVETLPVQWIGSQPQLLLSMGPEVRRRFLDMGLFHVEHSYLASLGAFQRALKQRNAAIRKGSIADTQTWNRPLAEAGVQLTERRRIFASRLLRRAGEVLSDWDTSIDIEHRFRMGWPAEESLDQVLERRVQSDLELGYTHSGPHRADMELLTQGQSVEKTLSRGQQKLLVIAMNLAMIDVVKQERQATGLKWEPVVLIDDLAAELDRENRARIVAALEERDVQVFVTAIDPATITAGEGTAPRVFHVEHGQVLPGTQLSD